MPTIRQTILRINAVHAAPAEHHGTRAGRQPTHEPGLADALGRLLAPIGDEQAHGVGVAEDLSAVRKPRGRVSECSADGGASLTSNGRPRSTRAHW